MINEKKQLKKIEAVEFASQILDGRRDFKQVNLNHYDPQGTHSWLYDKLRKYLNQENVQGMLREQPFDFSNGVIKGNFFGDLRMPYTIARDTEFNTYLGCDFSYGDFRKTHFENGAFETSFIGADLSDASFSDSLTRVNFSKANLERTHFHNQIQFYDCNFSECKNLSAKQLLTGLHINVKDDETRERIVKEFERFLREN